MTAACVRSIARTVSYYWEEHLPASVYATPITYRGKSGKQFVAAVDTGGKRHYK
jgi:glucose dehydrogenase